MVDAFAGDSLLGGLSAEGGTQASLHCLKLLLRRENLEDTTPGRLGETPTLG
jgi:hypothetical protein